MAMKIRPVTKPYFCPNEAGLKQKPAIDVARVKGASMIEIFTAILALFSAVVFAAHAIDAYGAD
jgi:hypothetical protein